MRWRCDERRGERGREIKSSLTNGSRSMKSTVLARASFERFTIGNRSETMTAAGMRSKTALI